MKQLDNIFLILLALFSKVFAMGQLTVESNIIELFSYTNDTSVYPGSDIISTGETNENAIKVGVRFMPENMQNDIHRSWHIDIRKNTIEWHPDLQLSIRRTDDGQHLYNNLLKGGEQYMFVGNSETLFLRGNGKILNISCQLKITGRSLTIPAKQYQTNIVFTLIDD